MTTRKTTTATTMDSVEENDLLKVKGGYQTPDRTVRVNQDDIDHAIRRDQHNCAIVRAIQRTYPDAIRVRANTEHVGFTIGEARYTYPTPPEAVEAIIKPLDTGDVPEPITVRLRGGKVAPVQHSEDRVAARNKWRNLPPAVKDNYPSRRAQMATNWREYNRFDEEA